MTTGPCIRVCGQKPRDRVQNKKKTRSSAIAEGPRDASCQLKSCQVPRNGAETTCTTYTLFEKRKTPNSRR